MASRKAFRRGMRSFAVELRPARAVANWASKAALIWAGSASLAIGLKAAASFGWFMGKLSVRDRGWRRSRQPARQDVVRHGRLTVEVTLRLVAAMAQQEAGLVLGLDAFSD